MNFPTNVEFSIDFPPFKAQLDILFRKDLELYSRLAKDIPSVAGKKWQALEKIAKVGPLIPSYGSDYGTASMIFCDGKVVIQTLIKDGCILLASISDPKYCISELPYDMLVDSPENFLTK